MKKKVIIGIIVITASIAICVVATSSFGSTGGSFNGAGATGSW